MAEAMAAPTSKISFVNNASSRTTVQGIGNRITNKPWEWRQPMPSNPQVSGVDMSFVNNGSSEMVVQGIGNDVVVDMGYHNHQAVPVQNEDSSTIPHAESGEPATDVLSYQKSMATS